MTTRHDVIRSFLALPIGMQFDTPTERAGEPSVNGHAPGAVVQLLGPPERLSALKFSIELDGPLGTLGHRQALLTTLIGECWPGDSALLAWALKQMRALFVPRTTMIDALDDTRRVRLACDRTVQRFNIVFRLSDD